MFHVSHKINSKRIFSVELETGNGVWIMCSKIKTDMSSLLNHSLLIAFFYRFRTSPPSNPPLTPSIKQSDNLNCQMLSKGFYFFLKIKENCHILFTSNSISSVFIWVIKVKIIGQ